jgi:hypothetical protein
LPGQHPRKVSKLSPALALGAATLVLGAGVAAQEAASLRPRPGSARTLPLSATAGAQGAAALGIRGSTSEQTGQPARAGTAARAVARRAATRRFRQTTGLPVQTGFRAATLSPATIGHVQPIFGPDPGPPLRLRKRVKEADPYAQVGYSIGGIALFPAVEQGVGYDSNPNRTSGPQKASLLLRSEGELRLESDWSRHELTGTLRGAYHEYPSVKGADRPEGIGRLNLRLDASRDTQIDLETRYLVDTQRPDSPELNAAVTERPLVASAGASTGVTQRFNRVSLGLRGSVDRTTYEDARLTSGAILDLGDRDRTQYEARLRAGYELKPGLVPFVEGIADTRVYDRDFDNAGFRRSSDAFGGRAGSTFEITRILTGEAAAGYMTRAFEDRQLKNLRGPIADGALIWSATPLTTVRLRGSTQQAETSIAGASGALVSRATVEVQHDLRRNLSLIGSATFSEADYQGIDLREEGFAGSVKLDYRFTRSVALRASFTHERLKSTDPGADYTANVYLVGLRFQP